MSKAGRKAKPTALKLVDGNPGKRRINQHEPQPAKVYDPDPPEGFDAIHAAKWNEVAGKLAKVRVLTELDLDALEVYCREWVNYHNAIADIATRGKLLQMPSGGVMWNPSWTQLKHSQNVCRSIMSEFGMTPSTRTSLVASADETGKNRWSSF
jgi:P27 family predicted phage terminase small subunit